MSAIVSNWDSLVATWNDTTITWDGIAYAVGGAPPGHRDPELAKHKRQHFEHLQADDNMVFESIAKFMRDLAKSQR